MIAPRSFPSRARAAVARRAFPVKAATLHIGQDSRANEMDFGWFTACGEIRRPDRSDRLLALRRERSEVAAFKATKAERHALRRETMLRAETPGELASARRTGEQAGRDEA